MWDVRAGRIHLLGMCCLCVSTCAHGQSGIPPSLGDWEETGPLVPHWDQVCWDDTRSLAWLQVEDVVDVAAVGAGIESAVRPTAGRDEATAEIGVHYHPTGELRRAYLMGSDAPGSWGPEVADLVVANLRPLGRLLEPLNIRVQVSVGDTPRVVMRPARHCAVHIAHDEEDEIDWGTGIVVTPGSREVMRDTSVDRVLVRLHLTAHGEISHVEGLRGNLALIREIEGPLRRMRFDPALINGEGVPGTLDLGVRILQVQEAASGSPRGWQGLLSQRNGVRRLALATFPESNVRATTGRDALYTVNGPGIVGSPNS